MVHTGRAAQADARLRGERRQLRVRPVRAAEDGARAALLPDLRPLSALGRFPYAATRLAHDRLTGPVLLRTRDRHAAHRRDSLVAEGVASRDGERRVRGPRGALGLPEIVAWCVDSR